MKIGLLDVDGHNFPNLPLMKISAYHKQRGDDVEFLFPLEHYDRVYVSKVFGEEYSDDYLYAIDADEVIYGGTGYAITIENGVIVSPVKVGDTVYQTDTAGRIYASTVKNIIYGTSSIAFDERAIGITVFLTKEEAEKALKGGAK